MNKNRNTENPNERERLQEGLEEVNDEYAEVEASKMTFLEHLDELRTRLIRSLIYTALGAIVTGIFWEDIFRLLLVPAGVKKLTYLGPVDAFLVKFKLALYAGLILSAPLVVYEILAFITPALTRSEKRVALPIVILTVLLFYSGIVVGYLFILPPGTRWLLAQGGDVMQQMLTADRYLSYAMMFLAGVGASFEVPIVIWVLSKVGLVTPKSLLTGWRYAVLIIVTAAAILTPDWSPITMTLFALPMVILYFLSILLIKIL
jgi:sec-independent protein translocase protein TatC